MKFKTLKRKYIVVTLLVFLLLISTIGGVLLLRSHKTPVASTPPQAIIDITANGFVPSTIKVKVGTIIFWQNQDSATHRVGSNPYPTDSSLPGLHSGAILPNGSYRYTTVNSGTVQYHDDAKPTSNGTIVISN
jgi:plastocyanin